MDIALLGEEGRAVRWRKAEGTRVGKMGTAAQEAGE